jgi:hypothetical protein
MISISSGSKNGPAAVNWPAQGTVPTRAVVGNGVIGTEALGWGRIQERITIRPQLATGSLNKDILRLLRSHVWRERNKIQQPD